MLFEIVNTYYGIKVAIDSILAWAGHLVHMNNDRALKKIFQHQTRWSKECWKTEIAMGGWC